MRLIRLEICNVRQYDKEVIFFPKHGLIGITGSNGAGKSTLANLVQWILYSKYENLTNEDLRNKKVTKKAPVYAILDFYYQKSYYRIMRSLSSSENKNFIEKDKQRIASGTKNINEYIEDTLFKMDCKAFKSCFYAAQGDFDALVKMNNAPRVQLISNLLQLNSIDIASEEDRKTRKNIETQLTTAKRMISNSSNLEEEFCNNEEKLLIFTKEQEITQTKITELEAAIKITSNLIVENGAKQKRYTELQQALSIAHEKQFIFDADILKLEEQLLNIYKLKKELHSLESTKIRYYDLLERKDELSEFKESLTKKQALESQAKQLTSNLNRINDNHSKLTTELSNLKDILIEDKELLLTKNSIETHCNELNELITQLRVTYMTTNSELKRLEVLTKNLNDFKSNSPCPTCSQIMSEEHKGREIKKLNLDVKSLTKELNFLEETRSKSAEEFESNKRQLNSIEKQLQTNTQTKNKIIYIEKELCNLSELSSDLVSQISDLTQSISKLDTPQDYNNLEFDSILSELEILKKQVEHYKQLSFVISNEGQIQSDKEEKLKNILETKNIEKSIINELKDLNFNESEFEDIKNRYVELLGAKNILINESNLNSLHSKTLEESQKQLEERIIQSKEQLDFISQKEQELLNYDKLDFLYKGYKGDKFAKLAPDLSKITSRLLNIATDGLLDRAVLEDTTYAIKVYNGDTLMDFNSFSGAQKKIIAICQRIAISQLLSTITNSHMELILFDEAFGSLDAQNQDNVVNLFRRLHTAFPQILIIAHNDYLKEQFDHTLEIDVATNGTGRKSIPKWILSEVGEPTFNIEELNDEILQHYNI